MSQVKRKWSAVSKEPHPVTHTLSAWCRICNRTKLSLVGSRLRRSLQTKSDTFIEPAYARRHQTDHVHEVHLP
ncbi:hypothetical protein MTR_4g106710 [Medicago truncatula]|uniref:Uncharacterized protein n=1 Tax=Medicago truncatula TaxID=3880 RepID=G7JNU2_MEDTR|nr:hypothetical protein MTR_4g106710 [Medicago truncatula]